VTAQLPALLVVVPLLGAAALLALRGHVRTQQVVSLLISSAQLGLAVTLLAEVQDGDVVRLVVGGWPSGVGISLVGDALAAILVVVAAGTLLAVLVFALGQLDDAEEKRYFHPLYQVLTAGIALAFLTGDLFNLFVSFEITLAASYVLLLISTGRAIIRPGITYVVINLLGSTLLLLAVAFIYAATGTVDMAVLTERVGDLPESLRTALRLLLVVVFGIKAAVFPLFNWLPDSYPTAPTAITAVFAGLLTKIGVYALIRTQAQVFGMAGEGPDWLLLWVAGLTMVVGVLGALAQDDMKRILSFHIISQVGFMIMGLGLFSVAGLAGAVLYMVHHIPTKTALFLVAGLVDRRSGTSSLAKVDGLLSSAPALAALFAVFALSLSGIPPLSGFVAKLSLVQAGLAEGQGWIVGASLLASLLTMISMTKVWNGAFLGAPTPPPDPPPSRQGWRLMTTATAGVLVATVAITAAAGPIVRVSTVAAEQLLVPTGQAVLVPGQTDPMVEEVSGS
jgi:multicomponent Na+:H+ antiporter subunit D